MKGEKSNPWKGDAAGKEAMHQWVKSINGKPQKCEMCGEVNKKHYDWANLYHTYKRIIKDYVRLCRSCHRKYDIKNNGYIFKRKQIKEDGNCKICNRVQHFLKIEMCGKCYMRWLRNKHKQSKNQI